MNNSFRGLRILPAGMTALGLVAGSLILSPTASAQTLMEALATAYSTNPELQSARAQLQRIDEGVPQALSDWRPNVVLSADLEREYTHNNTRTTTNRDQWRSPRNSTLTVTQPLFRGFRTVAGVAGAEADVLGQRASLIGSEQDILLSAATAYMAVVRDQAVLELNRNNLEVLRRQLEATQDRFQVGEITRTDVSQAEARVAGATASVIQAEGNLKTSQANYENIVGEKPGSLTAPTPLNSLPSNLQEVLELAGTKHPDVIQAQQAEKAADEDVKSKRGELYPALNLVGTLSRFWESTGNDSQITTGEVRLDLSVPIYQQGAVFSELRAAKLNAGKTRLDYAVTRRDRLEAAQSAWESLESARAQTKSFTAQIEAAEIALEGVRREAEVGSRTVLDVLDAEQELLDAQVNLVRAQRNEVVTGFQVMETTGQLTAATLALPVDVYDPTAYYKSVRGKLFGSGVPAAGKPVKP